VTPGRPGIVQRVTSYTVDILFALSGEVVAGGVTGRR
jgi:hypothetical protein